METHYQTLNCDQNASKRELKRQFQKLALQTHPDKNANTDSSQTFSKIGNAFRVLEDDCTRRRYDATLIDQRNESAIINEEFTISELQFDCEKQIYAHECRCGGVYCLKAEELKLNKDSFLISCDSCSLFILLRK